MKELNKSHPLQMSSESPLLVLCALQCEARPLIDVLRLKQKTAAPFSLWQNEQISLVISGVGKLQAACALTYALTFTSYNAPIVLNFGIGGSHNPIGTLFIANKVLDHSSKRAYYPQTLVKTKIPQLEIITVDTPCPSVSQNKIYEMEAFGVATAAVRFTSLEKIVIAKVISDNEEGIQKLKKEFVADLCAAALPPLLSYIEQIQEKIPPPLPPFPFAKCPFSFTLTEKKLVEKKWQKLQALNIELKPSSTKKELFNKLDTLLLGTCDD